MAVLENCKYILVINAGSSSVKCSLFTVDAQAEEKSVKRQCSGQISWISATSAEQTVTHSGAEKKTSQLSSVTFGTAVEGLFAEVTTDTSTSQTIKIDIVGHRVVHGGNNYSSSVLINDQVIDDLQALIELAPAHETANLKCIAITSKMFSSVP